MLRWSCTKNCLTSLLSLIDQPLLCTYCTCWCKHSNYFIPFSSPFPNSQKGWWFQILLQKVKELFSGGLLGMTLYESHLGGYRHLPTFRMDVDSYENLLSFEGNFVSLHIGTVLMWKYLVFCTYKNTIQLLSYQLFYAYPIIYLTTIRNFGLLSVTLHRSRTRKRALLRSNPPATWLCPHWKQCFKSRPAHGRLTDSRWAFQLKKPKQRKCWDNHDRRTVSHPWFMHYGLALTVPLLRLLVQT